MATDGIEAGSVYTRLGADFERAGFDQFDRAMESARREKAVKAELGANFDERAFDEFERALAKAEGKAKRRDAYKAALGGEFDGKAFAAAERAIVKHETDLRRMAATQERETARAAAAHERHSRRFIAANDQVGHSVGRLGRAVGSLLPTLSFGSRIPVYQIGAFAAAAAAAVPPVVALAGALGPLTGLLAAVPGLATTAGAAIVTSMLGLRGVGDAVGEAWDAQLSAATDATAAATKVETATDQVRAAEDRLIDTQRAERLAREDLTDAHQDATRAYEDLRVAADRAHDAERGSALSLREARQALGALDDDATALDRAQAVQRVREAENDLDDAQRNRARTTKDLADAEKGGVRGMPQMVEARRRLADAARDADDAEESLARATRDAGQAMSEGTAGANALEEKLADLSPAGRDFVGLIETRYFPIFRRLRNEAQEGLLPGLGDGLKEAERNLPVIEGMIVDVSGTLGDLSRDLGRELGSPAWGRDLERILDGSNRLLDDGGHAAINYAGGIRHIAVEAQPLVNWLGKANLQLSETFEQWAEGKRRSGDLERFFARTRRAVVLTVGTVWDLGKGLINIGSIGRRVWGDDMLDGIRDVAREFRDWTESVRGSEDIEGYFVRWRGRWHDITEAIERVIDRYRRLRKEGKSATEALTAVLSESLGQAFVEASEHVGRLVPKLVAGIVRGFLDADAWGKLAIAGWLIAKFGGTAAFLAIGRRAGRFFGLGFASGAGPALGAAGAAGGAGTAAGAAAGAGAGGLASRVGGRLAPLARKAGLVGLGLSLINGASEAFGDESNQASFAGKVENFYRGAFGIAGKNLPKEARKLATAILRGSDPGSDRRRGDGTSGFARGAIEGAAGALPGGGAVAGFLLDQKTEDAFDARTRRMLKRLRETRASAEELFGKSVVLKVDVRERDLFRIKENLRTLRDGGSFYFKDLRSLVEDNLRLIERSMDTRTGAGREAVEDNFRGMLSAIRTSLKNGSITADEAMRLIRRAMQTHSKGGQEAVSTNFRAAVRSIQRAVKDGAIASQKGGQLIEKIMLEYLSNFGIKGREARILVKTYSAEEIDRMVTGDTRLPDQRGGSQTKAHGYAAGGMVRPNGVIGRWGERGRDLVHAVVGRGEAVLNYAQQAIVNRALSMSGMRGGLREVFARTRGTRHAYAEGGFAGEYATGGYVQGAQEPSGPASGPIRALNNALFRRGFSVTSGGEYRGTGTGHDQQMASDYGDSVNDLRRLWGVLFPQRANLEELYGPSAFAGLYERGRKFSNAGLQADHEDHIHVMITRALRGALGRGAAAVGGLTEPIKLPPIKLEGAGAGSAFGVGVAASLDVVRRGAERKLNRILARAGVFDSGGGAGAGTATFTLAPGDDLEEINKVYPEHGLADAAGHVRFSPSLVQRIARWAGFGHHSDEMERIAHGESDYYPGIRGDDPGGTQGWGLWQNTPGVWGAPALSYLASLGGEAQLRNPLKNALMAKYLYDAAGGTFSPWYGTKYLAGGGFGGDGGSIADYGLPFVGGYEGGGNVGMNFSGGAVTPDFGINGLIETDALVQDTGLATGAGRGFTSNTKKAIAKLRGRIESNQTKYGSWSQRYDLTDEEFIIEGDEDTPPRLNQAAIDQRAAELARLISIQQKIVDDYQKLVDYITRLRQVYRVMRRRLERSINTAKANLKKLDGKKGRAAKKQRKAWQARLDKYIGAHGKADKWITTLTSDLAEEKSELFDARTGLLGDKQELESIQPGGSALQLPEWSPEEPPAADEETPGVDPAEAARQAREMFAAFTENRANLFEQFGSNFVAFSPASQFGAFGPASPFTDETRQAAGARFFGAVPEGPGAGVVAAAGGGRQVSVGTIVQNFPVQPDPHTWARGIDYELGAL